MIFETSFENKIKFILLNYDLLNYKIKDKIDTLFYNKIKINDEYLKKFKENFSEIEINSIYSEVIKKGNNNPVVYFSMEYGFSDLMPNYSGGLGILAGDYLKQASASGVNIIGIGLFYKYGYFYQKIVNNEQHEKYKKINIGNIVFEKLQKKGQDRIIKVKTDVVTIFAQIWRVKIGSSVLFLLDTDIDSNEEYIRSLTDKLYGGDREKRLLQEILLGIGGMKLIWKTKTNPFAIHINEGHAAFALLENTRRIMLKGYSFEDAYKKTKQQAIFTTHTPVIHGNEEFEYKLIEKHLTKYLKLLNFSLDDFIQYSSIDNSKKLMMTVLAIKSSAMTNAVSELHARTANTMWKDVSNNSILPVTNGIHINTWLNNDLKKELDLSDGDDYCSKISNLSEKSLITTRQVMKNKMINYINKRYHLKIQHNRIVLSFARRFAPYKRADLLFEDMHRIKRIFKNNNLIMFIAGKAHPEDIEGKAIINKILTRIEKYDLNERIFFLDNYDIELAKRLTSGSDIWLNTPLKPMEASGTSGMKSALNGGLNLSIADGWWAEGYSGKNGFVINEINAPFRIKQIVENNYLLNELEYKVLPVFAHYSSDNYELISMMKESMITIHKLFSAERMLNDYIKIYNKLNLNQKK
jgi:alpha-glucan phosphorylase-like protein